MKYSKYDGLSRIANILVQGLLWDFYGLVWFPFTNSDVQLDSDTTAPCLQLSHIYVHIGTYVHSFMAIIF